MVVGVAEVGLMSASMMVRGRAGDGGGIAGIDEDAAEVDEFALDGEDGLEDFG